MPDEFRRGHGPTRPGAAGPEAIVHAESPTPSAWSVACLPTWTTGGRRSALTRPRTLKLYAGPDDNGPGLSPGWRRRADLTEDHSVPHHQGRRRRCKASIPSGEPLISTSAASRRPKRNRSSSPGSPRTRTLGCPRRAVMTSSVPAHTTSSPTPRNRRDSNQCARATLRKRAASSAGGLVRGPEPFAGVRPRDGRRTR
jgi:hypothetical protein